MRRDHKPYYVKKAYLNFQQFYARKFLRPHFDHLGKGGFFLKPWCVELFGPSIEIGDYATVIATPDQKVRLSVWADRENDGRIQIGDYCLISPGVRIGSAKRIQIGDNCMFAGGAYITDSDWHGVYDRVSTGTPEPVVIGDNVWVGDGAIVCKGVEIGENSIVGARAVVVKNTPPNVITAGNPASIVKRLDPSIPINKRSHWYSDPTALARGFDDIDREKLAGNTLLHWIRSIFAPKFGD